MSERETCAICGYHGCPGHLYYGNDCSVTFKTDNTAVIRTLEKRIAGLEGTIGLERIAAHKLKEAAEQVVFECEADDDGMMPSVQSVRKLRALLGGGENGHR